MKSVLTANPTRARTKTAIWLLVAAGLLLLAAANAHLVYVATASQPDCVAHLKQGQGDAARGLFSAAGSACTPE
jgi:hypothetical protein